VTLPLSYSRPNQLSAISFQPSAKTCRLFSPLLQTIHGADDQD
jgi:hypothetical protein